MPDKNNLRQAIPSHIPEEIFTTLLATAEFKIERIVSQGQHSAPDFWYDQQQAEWILLIQGHAELEFEDAVISLTAGDYLNIPTHKKHRVKSTASDQITIWLAVFYSN